MLDLVTSSNVTHAGGLFGKTREAILDLLILRQDEQFHLRQISRLSGVGLGPVQRELAELAAMGVITREQSGRQVYFQARADCPILPELKQLLIKTSGAAGVLRAALSGLQSEIAAAAIFGSAASGKMHLESDIDLLLISPSLTMRDLGVVVREAGSRLGRDVNINLYRPDEWRERVRADHPLARSILENPRILLMGDDDELVGLAKERVAQATPGGSDGSHKIVRGDRTRPAGQRR